MDSRLRGNGVPSLDGARSKCEIYWRECNDERPQSVTGIKTPVAFIKVIGEPGRPTVQKTGSLASGRSNG